MGGKARVDTIAYMLNRAHRRGDGPVSVTISHAGSAFADHRIDELEHKTSRSEDEEREYCHLFKIKDFLEDAIAKLKYAIDLAVNDDRFRKGTVLTVDERLSQYLIGLRNSSFGLYTPIFLEDCARESSWMVDRSRRPIEWNIWCRGDTAMQCTIRVTEQEAKWICNTYRSDLFGDMVLEEHTAFEVLAKHTAFDIFALALDTFYEIALPQIALAIAGKWQKDHRSLIPNTVMDLSQWVFSPASPAHVTRFLV